MMKRVLILVTHLLGAGHLTRASALAGAFAKAGHPTTLVSGGMQSSVAAPPGVTFVQLPPVQTRGTNFSVLLDEGGDPVTQTFLDARSEILLEALRRARPDVLITELFPFGRRVLAQEFLTVLEDARLMRPRPLVLASIRDILVAPSKPERIEQTMTRIAEFYDAVLVHGDPAIAPLELSWPANDRLRPLLHYTGYVDEGAPVASTRRAGIVVSGGSSAASLPLYRAALASSCAITDRSWRVLVGRGISDDEFRTIQLAAPGHVIVERARADFRQLLAGAELSISQAGYNTTVDILRSGVRAILVPFEAGHETEQRQRADCLQRAGLAQVLPENDLNERSLATAILSALARPLPSASSIALDGATRSVTIATGLAVLRPAVHGAAVDWSPLDEALTIARERGREPAWWWRDDDAVADTPELDRLLRLANSVEAHLSLAAIPERLEASLAIRLKHEAGVSVLVHGHAHTNYAPPGEKKAEFGPHRDLATMIEELRAGLHRLRQVFGKTLVPVFVPPWNRVAPALIPALSKNGYIGLSTFGNRKTSCPAPGIRQVNTHLDPIDWHAGRSLGDVPALVATLARAVSDRAFASAELEPIGFLTHHLAHDDRVWAFCEELILFLARKQVHFAGARKLFCDKCGNVVEP